MLTSIGCGLDTRLSEVQVSLRKESHWCEGCPGYELEFNPGGRVRFRGLRGCALPGIHEYDIPANEFPLLVASLEREGFFRVPRAGRRRATHADVIVITYRDNSRIHETVDIAREDPRLTRLARRLYDAGRIARWVTPTPELYQEKLRKGWNPNTVNEDGWTALTCAVSQRRTEAVKVLLEHRAVPSWLDFKRALGRREWPDSGIFVLLDQAAPLDVHGQFAATLLAGAAYSNDVVKEYLLKRGVPEARPGK